MKNILAIVRMDKLSETKNVLSEAGVSGFTCRRVTGRGKKVIHRALYSTLEENGELPVSPVGEYITEGTRLIPKRLFSIIVSDGEVDKTIQSILEVNSTGNPGDGKIFVIPMTESYRVRDGKMQTDSDYVQ